MIVFGSESIQEIQDQLQVLVLIEGQLQGFPEIELDVAFLSDDDHQLKDVLVGFGQAQ